MMEFTTTTCSGRLVDLTAPRPEDIALAEIATSLSQQNRFNGNLEHNYTVLEHSMCGANLFVLNGMYSHAITFLLHDAHEAYIGDIASPVKRYLSAYTDALRNLEVSFNEAIRKKLMPDSAVPFDNNLVVAVDKRLGEREHLRAWGGTRDLPPIPDELQPHCAWSGSKVSLSHTYTNWKPTSRLQKFVCDVFDQREKKLTPEKSQEVFLEYYDRLLAQLAKEDIKARRNK